MRLRDCFFGGDHVVAEIARFGSARLVRLARGSVVVRGGTHGERMEAREWASLFCHEAVVEMEEAGNAAGRKA